jgi:hypothetical protein
VAAFRSAAAEHAIPELCGPEVAEHVAASRFDVERLAREHVEMRDAVVRERVTARVALREQHDAGDRQRSFEPMLGETRRSDRREAQLERQLDKRFANTVLRKLRGVATHSVRYPMKTEHGITLYQAAPPGELPA